MHLYRFSPISTQDKFNQALVYITLQARTLAEHVVGRELPVDTVTIFAHYDEEYEFLEGVIRNHGPESKFTHGTTLYIECDHIVEDQHIRLLGVRRPDPYRMQVGYRTIRCRISRLYVKHM